MIPKIKANAYPTILASLQWCVTSVLQVDRAFFTYGHITEAFIIVKVCYLLFLMVAWHFGFKTYRKLKAGDAGYKRGTQVFLSYFSIMAALLVVLWPGTWSWDDLWTLDTLQWYQDFFPWQHIITGIYLDVMLQILPFPGGAIFLQILIVSLCVAFSVTKLEQAYHLMRLRNFYADMLLKLLPFLLPPVLMYQFSGYRMGLYVYLELVMLVIVICAIKDQAEWGWGYLVLFCFLCVIAATWRTESFFYMPLACASTLFINPATLPRMKKALCLGLLIAGFWGMGSWQSRALGNSNYQIISLLRPCAELVRAAGREADAGLLNQIDPVANLDIIRDNPAINGEALYWDFNVVRTGYSNEEYQGFLKAFVKLALKYPKVAVVERWKLFIASAGVAGPTVTNVHRTAALFDENNDNQAAKATFARGWIANAPAFKTARKSLIHILGGYRLDGTDAGMGLGFIRRLIWNAILPMVLLLYGWLKLLAQRKWYLWFVCTAVLIKVPIVILTQPSHWLMYVLSFYFLGYVYIVYHALLYFSNKKGNANE